MHKLEMVGKWSERPGGPSGSPPRGEGVGAFAQVVEGDGLKKSEKGRRRLIAQPELRQFCIFCKLINYQNIYYHLVC